MKLVVARVPERAAPVLALECDGALYDVAELEASPPGDDSAPARGLGAEFFCRVIAARCAGLAELEARVASGLRPTEARLLDGRYLLLPPCAEGRAAYWQIRSAARGAPIDFALRDARALAGDAQPVCVPDALDERRFQVGLAAVLAEDLEHASAHEARRALLGVTLIIDWGPACDEPSCGDARASHVHGAGGGALAPAHLGAQLAVGAVNALFDLELEVKVGGVAQPPVVARYRDLDAYERIADLSRYAPLRAGDVIGLGPLALPSHAGTTSGTRVHRVGLGAPVEVRLGRALRLKGTAMRAREQ